MKPVLVAEIGINHNGDLSIAKRLIINSKAAGCDYVKFQKRTIEDVYTKEELDQFRESPWGTTNRDQKYGLEFEKEQYDEIDKFCKEQDIGWFGSPWDIKSVDFLMQYDPEYIKIASALITDVELLMHVKKLVSNTRTKVIISTGMSNEKEIVKCVDILGDDIEYILSCVSTYPTRPKEMNMLKIRTLKNLFGANSFNYKYKIGFSNHSPSLQFVFMGYFMGAEMIEYHITLDRSLYGSDQSSSIEFGGMLKINDWIKDYEIAYGDSVICCIDSELPIRKKLRKNG